MDPNYKMKFFDRCQRDLYKSWIIDELSKAICSKSPVRRPTSPEIERQYNPSSALLDEYLNVLKLIFNLK